MNGDRRPKMSPLARAVEWCEDCMQPKPRIKGEDKRRQRKLARRIEDEQQDYSSE